VKYMGSKRSMLQNGLGDLLKAEMPKHERVVDLFCGGSSVSWFAATNSSCTVHSVDLQAYAVAMAAAVTERDSVIDSASVVKSWTIAARTWAQAQQAWPEAESIDTAKVNTATWVKRSRHSLETLPLDGSCLVTRCYGGHYFSLTQALLLDGLINTFPSGREYSRICMASAIIAASKCAAAPGHTAQPFQPTRTAGRFLREAWKRDPLAYASQALAAIAPKHARKKGTTSVADAVSIAESCQQGDLVFVDPPYSAVQYSRFYHVLETIARRKCVSVEGVGRYPPPGDRPTSAFSRKSEATAALRRLLKSLAGRGCTVILTFPVGDCSNGLSGDSVRAEAEKQFVVAKQKVRSRFSTLGGNNENRVARHDSKELILLLRPM
jgi:hypothetical protein